jgi:multidrug efflux pump subunit AcrA (membrane-fusion protein)
METMKTQTPKIRKKKKNARSRLKWTVPAVLLCAGAAVTLSVPALVEYALPEVTVASPVYTSYSDTVRAVGSILLDPTDNEWYAAVYVSERDIRKVQPGQTAALSGSAFDDGIYTATVDLTADTAHTITVGLITETVVDLRLKLDNPDGNLRSGYTTNAEIAVSPEKRALTVPYDAVLQDDGGEYVYVLEMSSAFAESRMGVIRRRDISTGKELPEAVEVLAGLTEADSVVIPGENGGEGLDLSPNMPVKVTGE